MLKEWSTGIERRRLTFTAATDSIEDFDVAEDGRVLLFVLSGSGQFLQLIDPSGATRRVAVDGAFGDSDVRLSGRFAVLRSRGRYEGDGHIAAVNLTTGAKRRLSPPSQDLDEGDRPPVVQGDLVAWSANGCALVARVSGPGALTVPAGPCRRSELVFDEDDRPCLRGRTVWLRIRCLTAPAPGCRGTVKLKLERVIGKGRFTIPQGRKRAVGVLLTRRGVRALRREFVGDPGGVLVGFQIRVADGLTYPDDPSRALLLRPQRPR